MSDSTATALVNNQRPIILASRWGLLFLGMAYGMAIMEALKYFRSWWSRDRAVFRLLVLSIVAFFTAYLFVSVTHLSFLVDTYLITSQGSSKVSAASVGDDKLILARGVLLFFIDGSSEGFFIYRVCKCTEMRFLRWLATTAYLMGRMLFVSYLGLKFRDFSRGHAGDETLYVVRTLTFFNLTVTLLCSCLLIRTLRSLKDARVEAMDSAVTRFIHTALRTSSAVLVALLGYAVSAMFYGPVARGTTKVFTDLYAGACCVSILVSLNLRKMDSPAGSISSPNVVTARRIPSATYANGGGQLGTKEIPLTFDHLLPLEETLSLSKRGSLRVEEVASEEKVQEEV